MGTTENENTDFPSNRYKSKILVVDDDEVALELFEEQLNEYEVSKAPNIHEAINLLKQNKYDLAIIDVNLPSKEHSGKLLEEITKNYSDMPFILTTASEVIPMEHLQHQPADYLKKPFALTESRSKVKAAISSDSSIDESTFYKILENEKGIDDLEKRVNDEIWFSSLEDVRDRGGRRKENITKEEGLRRVLAPKIMIFHKDENERISLENKFREDYNVISASTYAEAVEFIKGEVDIVVCENPGMAYAMSHLNQTQSLDANLIAFAYGPSALLDSRLGTTRSLSYVSNIQELIEEVKSIADLKEAEANLRVITKRNLKILYKKIEQDPGNPELHYQLGLTYGSTNPEKAVLAFLDAYMMDPHQTKSLEGIAQIIDQHDITKIPLQDEKIETIYKGLRQMDENTNENAQKALAKISTHFGKTDTAIEIYQTLIESNPNNAEYRVRLGVAYLKKGEQEKAEGTFRDILENLSKNELYIGLENLSDYEDLSDGTLLAEISQHKVYGIVSKGWGKDYLIKVHDRKFRENALTEKNNLIALYNVREQLKMPNGTLLRVPKLVLYAEGPENSILVLERLKCKKVDEEFANADESAQIEHLDQIVDATVVLSDTRTKQGELNDVKATSQTISISPARQRKVGFYTKRFFDKWIGQFEKYKGITLSNRKKTEVIRLHRPINDIIIAAPDFFSQFYTDCNYRNFGITKFPQSAAKSVIQKILESDDYSNRLRTIRGAERCRFDLESGDKRMFMLDFITAAEHELYGCGNKRNTEYVIRRAILGFIALNTEDEKAKQHINEILKGDIDARKEVADAFRTYFEPHMQSLGIKYTAEQAEELIPYCSLQRHLTVAGDKLRDIHNAQNHIELFRDEYPVITREYEAEIKGKRKTEIPKIRKTILVKLAESDMISEYEKQLELYLDHIIRHENANLYFKSHVAKVKDGCRKTGQLEFLDKLQEYYKI